MWYRHGLGRGFLGERVWRKIVRVGGGAGAMVNIVLTMTLMTILMIMKFVACLKVA